MPKKKLDKFIFIGACQEGDVETVKSFIEQGIDVDVREDVNRWTCLMFASAHGQHKVVKILLENGANVNAKNERRQTALMEAVRCGDLECVKELVKYGADVNAKSFDYETPLKLTLFINENLEIADFLIKNGADVNNKLSNISVAVEERNAKIVRFLLEHGADRKSKDIVGRLPIEVASNNGCLEIVKLFIEFGADNEEKNKALVTAHDKKVASLLLENGADINYQTAGGYTPLFYAAEIAGRGVEKKAELTKYLLEHGADGHFKNKKGETIIDYVPTDDPKEYNELIRILKPYLTPKEMNSLERKIESSKPSKEKILCDEFDRTLRDEAKAFLFPTDDLEAAKRIVEKIEDVNIEKGTLLRKAAWSGKPEIVRRLLSKGADVNLSDKDKKTALMVALYPGRFEVARILIDAGADTNVADKKGQTILFHACASPSSNDEEIIKLVEIIKLLIDKGADVNAGNKHGITPLMNATQRGLRKVVEILLENGADVNAKDKHGRTALMYSYYDNLDILELLIKNGADVNAQDKNGKTALMLAAYYACTKEEAFQFLIDHGADVHIKNKYGKTALDMTKKHYNYELARILKKYMKK